MRHAQMSEQSLWPALLERYRPELIHHLQGSLFGDSILFRMVRYQLGLEDQRGRKIVGGLGKALRPALCLFACEALGGDWRKALPAAVAIELVHNFSLSHDDICDGDKERRHRPTVWALWGVGQAINAGDALHALSSITLCELEGMGFAPECTNYALRLLASATLEMIEGQCLDLEYEGRFDLKVQDYISMISRKTGALMACALELGALLGGADAKKRGLFQKAGRNLGLAFQIRDDLLGIWGEPSKTGKPASDLLKKKRTLPIIYALERPESRQQILEYLKCDSPAKEDVNALSALLEKSGALGFSQELALYHGRLALASLEEIPLSPWALKAARELVAFAVRRES